MKCPLSFRTMYSNETEGKIFGGKCIKEKCTWWNNNHECCQMVELVNSLTQIELHLWEIMEKMPHAGQFVK